MKRGNSRSFVKLWFTFMAALTLLFFSQQLGCGGGGNTTKGDGGAGDKSAVESQGCKTNAECAAGEACIDGKCQTPECTNDSECQGGTCKNGKCEKDDNGNKGKDECQSAGDCPPGQDCVDDGGVKKCKKAQGNASKVAKVVILTKGGVIREGQKKTFKAAAYNKSGARITGQLQFKWSSSDSAVVSIDENTGEATGGSKDGTAQITAELDGVKSDPVTVRNFAKLAGDKVRIVLIDPDGNPVEGAKVVLAGKSGKKEVSTDKNGVATADGVKTPLNIHIFHQKYSYLSIFNVNKTDLLIQLAPDKGTQKAGGVEGTFKLDKLKTLLNLKDWDDRTVGIGIAGLSIADNIFALDFQLLLGEMVEVEVLGNQTKVPMGVYLDLNGGVKPNFKAQSTPGRRILWGFGGKFALATLTSLIPQGGGNLDIGTILSGAKPLFKEMGFGFSPDIEVKAGNFAKKDLFVNYLLKESLKVNVSKVPTVSFKGKNLDLLVVSLVGVLLPGYGLVPLGLMIDQGKAGKSVSLDVKYAQRVGPLAGGKKVVITIAFNLALQKKDKPPVYVFGDVQFTDSKSVSVGSFLPIPKTSKFDPAKRMLAGMVQGATLNHVTFSKPNGKEWIAIYSGVDNITFPNPPSGFSDPIGTIGTLSMRGVVLDKGQTMDSVLEFNTLNMDRLTEIIKQFNNLTVYEKKK